MREPFKSISITAESLPYIAITCSEMLEGMVVRMMDRGLTLATAESCTGGLVGSMITEIPGVSAVYLGGVISYHNRIKTDVVGVSHDTIEQHTEVSAQTAGEMARGLKEKFGSDIGVSVTGFAGPGGGDENNPVGTVYVAAATDDETVTLRISCDGEMSRADIRRTSAYVIFGLVCKILQRSE